MENFSVKELEQQAMSGNSKAQFTLGLHYESIDLNRAFGLLLQVVDNGSRDIKKDAKKELGKSARTRDIKDWYPELAKKGNAEAQYYEGLNHYKKEQNLSAAFPYFLSAAGNGYWKSYGFVALAYEQGQGVKANRHEMVHWLQKFVEDENANESSLEDVYPISLAEATYQLGLIYLEGSEDFNPDFEKALKCFRDSVAFGNVRGYYWYGLCDDFGYNQASSEMQEEISKWIKKTVKTDKVTADKEEIDLKCKDSISNKEDENRVRASLYGNKQSANSWFKVTVDNKEIDLKCKDSISNKEDEIRIRASLYGNKQSANSWYGDIDEQNENFAKAQYCLAVNLMDLQNLRFCWMAEKNEPEIDTQCDDLEQAFKIFRTLAGEKYKDKPEHDKSLEYLGKANYTGNISDWYQKLAEEGNVKAQFHVAETLRESGSPVDVSPCLELYQSAWDSLRHPIAAYFGYPNFKNGTEDERKAYNEKILPAAAEYGITDAQYEYGNFLQLKNDATDNELKTSFEYLLKAAEKDNTEAMFSVGYAYGAGKGVERDRKQAVNWYQRYIDNNGQSKIIAESNIGLHYYIGDEYLKKDYKIAFDYFTEAAKGDDDVAEEYLGCYYLNGIEPVALDYSQSRYWNKLSATKKNSYAEWHLAYLLKNGLGGAMDLPGAFEYYLMAAKAGQEESRKEIGQAYETGDIKDWLKKLILESSGDETYATDAKYELALELKKNVASETDLVLAFQLFKELAEVEDERAKTEIEGVNDAEAIANWFSSVEESNKVAIPQDLSLEKDSLGRLIKFVNDWDKISSYDLLKQTSSGEELKLVIENGDIIGWYEKLISESSEEEPYLADAKYNLAIELKEYASSEMDHVVAFQLFKELAEVEDERAKTEIEGANDTEGIANWFTLAEESGGADISQDSSLEKDSLGRLIKFVSDWDKISSYDLLKQTSSGEELKLVIENGDIIGWYEKLISESSEEEPYLADAKYNLAIELKKYASSEMDFAVAFQLLKEAAQTGNVLAKDELGRSNDTGSISDWYKIINEDEGIDIQQDSEPDQKSLERLLNFVNDKEFLYSCLNKYTTLPELPNSLSDKAKHNWKFYNVDIFLREYLKNQENRYIFNEKMPYNKAYHIPDLSQIFEDGEEAYDYALEFEQSEEFEKAVLIYEYAALNNCKKAFYTLVNMSVVESEYFIYINEDALK